MLLSPYLPFTFRLKREYWPVERNSVRCPLGELLKGIAFQPVETTLPVLVVRKMLLKSAKPPGVNSVPPMRTDRGEVLGFSTSACISGVLGLAEELALTLVNVAFSTCGVAVADVFASSCFCSISSCCCCAAICACCAAICFCCAPMADCSVLT